MRELALRWIAPALLAILLAGGTWFTLNVWQRHQLQHQQADQDHLLLQQVIQVLNQQARQPPPPAPSPPPR